MQYKNEITVSMIGLDNEYSYLFITATKSGKIRNKIMKYCINDKMHWIKI